MKRAIQHMETREDLRFSYRKVPGDRHTPFGLAVKLQAACLLESSSFVGGTARFSLLMVDEAFRIEQRGNSCVCKVASESVELPASITEKLPASYDILDVIQAFGAYHTDCRMPFPVPAGGIGYLTFEFSGFCDTVKIPKRSKPATGSVSEEPLLGVFLFGHVYLIFDHYTDEIHMLALEYPGFPAERERLLEKTEKTLFDQNYNYLTAMDTPLHGHLRNTEKDDAQFLAAVKTVKHEIIEGNLLQAVVSRRLEIDFQADANVDGLAIYRNLRTRNPSPYQFYFNFGEYQLLGASPEMHIKVQNSTLMIRPIAGTRRRGRDRDEDIALEKELLADEKECAEHIMLVDLARNDIGRVCRPGSVEVTESMIIERYSRVMHIVSQVEGILAEGKTAYDAVRATFPAGTVSGAPKIRAIETVLNLESEARGWYAGLAGYFEPNGNFDSCITIRSAHVQNGVMTLQAGAGIVYDSLAERELEETNEKLRALAAAVGVEV